MRRIILCLALALIVAFGFGVNSANALLILSGDSNLTDPLLPGGIINNPPVDTGNQQFFINVLGGGSSVAVLDENSNLDIGADWDDKVNDFYNSLFGVTSSLVPTVTEAALFGVDLFVATDPVDAFTASEITALSNFLADDGTVFFLGENSGFPAGNGIINDALSALGSGMSIIPDTVFDAGWWTATGSQIANDPLTTGVDTFTYAAPSEIELVSGGTTLFFGSGGQPFLAYEATAVPEPSTLLLIGSGLLGLAGFRRKFHS